MIRTQRDRRQHRLHESLIKSPLELNTLDFNFIKELIQLEFHKEKENMFPPQLIIRLESHK